jgi:hypothetical protein
MQTASPMGAYLLEILDVGPPAPVRTDRDLVLLLLVQSQGNIMSNSIHQCCTPGCGTSVPAELENEGFCVPHFLSSAEKACADIRREAAAGESSSTRLAEFESYVAASAMKLALVCTGSVRLSDEIKKRVLTTFLTLMILRENLDRPANPFLPRRSRPTSPVLAAVSAEVHI